MTINKLLRDFVSEERRTFKFQIGQVMASSLAGFVIGAVVATIILVTGYVVFMNGNLLF